MKINVKFIGIISVVLVVLLLTAGCCSSTDTSKPSGGYPASQQTQVKDFVGHVGDSIESSSSSYHINWGIVQAIRGSQANSIVKDGNMFNQEPNAGYEYLLYRVVVTNIDDEKYSVYPSTWKAYANGVEASQGYAVLPNNYVELSYIDIMPGATADGWICVQVPISSSVKIYFEPMFSYGNTQKVYIEI